MVFKTYAKLHLIQINSDFTAYDHLKKKELSEVDQINFNTPTGKSFHSH
jgi:hypothetical protein